MCGLEVFCLFLSPSLGWLRVQNCIQDEAAPLCCDTFTVLLQLDQPSYSFWHSPMRESRYSYRKMKGRKERSHGPWELEENDEKRFREKDRRVCDWKHIVSPQSCDMCIYICTMCTLSLHNLTLNIFRGYDSDLTNG